jgi:hypothetical protein
MGVDREPFQGGGVSGAQAAGGAQDEIGELG